MMFLRSKSDPFAVEKKRSKALLRSKSDPFAVEMDPDDRTAQRPEQITQGRPAIKIERLPLVMWNLWGLGGL